MKMTINKIKNPMNSFNSNLDIGKAKFVKLK